MSTPPVAALAVGGGLCVTAAVAAMIVSSRENGTTLAALALGAGLLMVGTIVLLVRRPELAPWGAVILFVSSGELKLRVSPLVGVAKDGYVVLLGCIALAYLWRHPTATARLRHLAFPGAAMAVLVGLYLVSPAGSHGASWLFGTRLLLEAVALLLVGLVLAPKKALGHLVAVVTVMLPVEAVLAWLQQVAGVQALVYQWGYQYGSQVRATSGGALRTSGTFEDPFQLAALAVIGLAMALFVASRWQALVLIVSAVAILGATSVRTAIIQTGVLVMIWALRRGWWRQALALAGVAALAGALVLGTSTSAVRPGAPEEPLLFTLNGRSTAWSQAIDGWQSLFAGNGVGRLGTGSTRTSLSAGPPNDPNEAQVGAFAGSPAFLDSAYAQVQSDVGLVGTVALLMTLGGVAGFVVRCCRTSGDGAPWAAGAVLLVSMIDWIGRSSLTSYTTGFLTLYVLGILLAASEPRRHTR